MVGSSAMLQGMGGQQSVGDGFGQGFDELARGGDGDRLYFAGDAGVVDGLFDVVVQAGEPLVRAHVDGDFE